MTELPRILIVDVGVGPPLGLLLAQKLAGLATVEVVTDPSALPAETDAPGLVGLDDLPDLLAMRALPAPWFPSDKLDRLLPPARPGPPRRGKKGKPLRW